MHLSKTAMQNLQTFSLFSRRNTMEQFIQDDDLEISADFSP